MKEPEEIKHSSSTEIKMEKGRKRQRKRTRKIQLQEEDIEQDKKEKNILISYRDENEDDGPVGCDAVH